MSETGADDFLGVEVSTMDLVLEEDAVHRIALFTRRCEGVACQGGRGW